MNPWLADPTWQNYSSMYREAQTACIARTDLERYHHLTAALYFGMSALEAFINAKMRSSLASIKAEDEIFRKLRYGSLLDKLKDWPPEILGRETSVSKATLDLISVAISIRNDLTHPKEHGRQSYAKLETIDPNQVIEAVAEYFVRFHEADGSRYPYWVFGWNYLNPSSGTYAITLIHDQQFSFSLQAIGFDVPAAIHYAAEEWRNKHLGRYDGYVAISKALKGASHCEAKHPRFPHKPVLCRRWWTDEHQITCGNVTPHAISIALEHDNLRRR